MEPYLALKDISVRNESKEIINIDRLSLCKGESLGLMGENGAGKSTLLRVLALLEKPVSGHVLFQGSPVGNVGKLRKIIAIVFQNPLLFKGKVSENISYPLKIRKISKNETKKRCIEVANAFEVGHLMDRNVDTLSGGEAKRVCLARALVYQPDVLLLDEPFSDLDINIRSKIEEQLFLYVQHKHITTVFVSHNFEEIVRFCNRLAVMREGMIVQCGLVDELLQKPRSKYIASFLGGSSFIEAEIKSASRDMATVKVAQDEFKVVGHFPGKVANGQKVFLNLRPEDIFISNNGAFKNSSVRNSFKARIANIDHAHSLCRLRLESSFVSEAIVTKQSVEELELHAGKLVVAGFKATAAKLLLKD